MKTSDRRGDTAPYPRAAAALACCLCLALTAAGSQKQTREVPVDSLIYDLKNPDPVRRKDAAATLGNNKVVRAVPDLVAAASDADPLVRREVVVALDKMRDVRALPAFVQLSSDADKEIRDKSISGLINLYLPQEGGLVVTLNRVANFFNPWSDEWADVVIEPGIRVDPRTIQTLQGRLQDPDEGIRTKAARGLGIVKGNDAIGALVQTLNRDSSNSVRFESIRALRKIGNPSVSQDLINLLVYPDRRVRNEAVFALGRLRSKEAVPELTRLFERELARSGNEKDRSFLEQLLDALAFIAEPESRGLFDAQCLSREGSLRLHAFEGLARLGDASMVTDLSRDRLSEKDPKVRAAQAFGLYRMGRKEYLGEVVRGLSNRRTNREATQYLMELRPAERADLYAEAKTDDVNVREGIAEVLGLIGDAGAIPTLEELGKDRRGQIAALANQAIRRINARRANPTG